MKNVIVSAAIISRAGNVLCVQRPRTSKRYISLKWEFPGGKVEADIPVVKRLMGAKV